MNAEMDQLIDMKCKDILLLTIEAEIEEYLK